MISKAKQGEKKSRQNTQFVNTIPSRKQRWKISELVLGGQHYLNTKTRQTSQERKTLDHYLS